MDNDSNFFSGAVKSNKCRKDSPATGEVSARAHWQNEICNLQFGLLFGSAGAASITVVLRRRAPSRILASRILEFNSRRGFKGA